MWDIGLMGSSRASGPVQDAGLPIQCQVYGVKNVGDYFCKICVASLPFALLPVVVSLNQARV